MAEAVLEIGRLAPGTGEGESHGMLVLSLKTEMPLSEPSVDYGFLTTLDVSVRQFDSASPDPIGQATVTVIHTADAMNRAVRMEDVLDADSEEMAQLFEVFFDDDEYLQPEFQNGAGFNVLYFGEIELVPTWRARHIEEAIVRRVVDTWGEGCAIAVIPVEGAGDVERWAALGFVVPGGHGAPAFVYLDLSLKQPDVLPVDGDGHRFEVRPVPQPADDLSEGD